MIFGMFLIVSEMKCDSTYAKPWSYVSFMLDRKGA